MIRILGRANSFNVRKMLWACAEQWMDWANYETLSHRAPYREHVRNGLP